MIHNPAGDRYRSRHANWRVSSFVHISRESSVARFVIAAASEESNRNNSGFVFVRGTAWLFPGGRRSNEPSHAPEEKRSVNLRSPLRAASNERSRIKRAKWDYFITVRITATFHSASSRWCPIIPWVLNIVYLDRFESINAEDESN